MNAVIKKSSITINVTDHADKDSVFYEFTLRGVDESGVIPWLERVLKDLKGNTTVIYRGKKEEGHA